MTPADLLPAVTAATLLIVGENDQDVLRMNKTAYNKMSCCRDKQIVTVPHATHLFSEPGTLEQAANAAVNWFKQKL